MYLRVGTSKEGLALWRSIRGSSKNEAVNLVIEKSLQTTAPMQEDTALGESAI
jgi:hypothetical protein